MFDLVDKVHMIHMVLNDHIQYDIDNHLIVSKRFELKFDRFHLLQHFLVHLDCLFIKKKKKCLKQNLYYDHLPIQGESIFEEFKRKNPSLHVHNDEPLSFV